MKINRNADASLNPKTSDQPESTKPEITTSKGIATAKDGFTDSENNKLSSALGNLLNPAGFHNQIGTTDSHAANRAADDVNSLVPPPKDEQHDSGWVQGPIFKSPSNEDVTIAATGRQNTVTSKKDDDD
jgi:hypothetical protein